MNADHPTELTAAERRVADINEVAEALHRVGVMLAADLDQHRLVQAVTDEATHLAKAEFGAFFYHVVDPQGETYLLYAHTGREGFSNLPVPQSTAQFGPTFRAEAVIRLDDVTLDPHFGENPLFGGLPQDHPPVRSYLAVPVVSRSGQVLGGLFFGHSRPGVFTEREERLVVALAAPAAAALDHARLYHRTTKEVAERKRAEEVLREREERLKAIIDTTPECIKVVAPDGAILEMNAAGLSLIEADHPAQAVGKSVYALIAPECRDEYRAFHEAVCRGQGGALEFEVISLRGNRRRVETVAAPLGTTGGALANLSITHDITERRQAEEDLLLRDRAIRAVSEGILITDATQPDNPIIFVSPGFERMTGYTAQEVIGRNCRFLQGRETDTGTVAQVREAIRAGQAITVELLNYRKDGRPFWNDLSLSPVHDGDGRMTHFVGVQADVTGRRRLEEQFRQSQKMEAIGRLAGGVAHDFNNLLTIISGYSDLLLTGLPADDPTRGLVKEIRQAGERAAGLTRQLLTFSRQQVVETKVLNLNAVVTDTERMLRRLIGEDLDLRSALDPELGNVKADAGQVEQVIMNLVVNAGDAMPHGGRITIETANVDLDDHYARTHPEVKPGPYVMLAVADTGCGMDGTTQARIFEPFFTTKGPGKGTGLGLATVYGIVTQGGGHLAVYSEVGVGTTFKAYFPRVRERAPSGKSSQGGGKPPQGTETVLVVEDEDGVRALTRYVLQACGYTVLEARDGKEAVRLAERHKGPLHLLVTDVVMPGMGGRLVAEAVAGLHPHVKVLYLSGYTDDAVVRHGVLAAETAFLQKPYSPHTLAAKVREVLGPQVT